MTDSNLGLCKRVPTARFVKLKTGSAPSNESPRGIFLQQKHGDGVMNRKIFGLTLSTMLLALCVSAEAQQPAKVYRLGILSVRGAIEPRDEVFRQRLRELGYVEGQNLAIEWRFSDGKLDRLDSLAAELVRLKVDAIFGTATPTIQAAKKATTTIPIVMIAGADPAETGLVASLERPGGNITGLTSVSAALNGKRMELAKEMIPNLARVGVLLDPNYPTITAARSLQETQSAADSLGLKLQVLEVRSAGDFDAAFEAASKEQAKALIHFSHAVITNGRKRVTELALKHKLPAVYADTQFMDVGGLMSLGADPLDLTRRAAGYVDRIFKGAKPAEMPMEKPTKFELVINLKTAQQIGVNIPEAMLRRADNVIK
jgi:putative ABC transport system substrate-binding protein